MARGFLAVGVVLLGLALAGCTDYGNGGQSDGEDGRDDGEVLDGDAGGDQDVACAFGDEFVQQFDKSCASDGDCVIVFCAADCCGTGQAVGLNSADQERFDKAWEYCLTQLPMCGCPSGPTQVEDGSSTWDHDSIRVRCSGNACSTYIP